MASIERLDTREYSLSKTWVRCAVIRFCSAVEHVAEPNRGLLMPVTGTGPLVLTWYWAADLPVRYTALPETLTQVKVALPLPDA